MRAHALSGVYNARGGLRGELLYVVGKALGRVHCGLCDVTHGLHIRERPEWRERRSSLGVPVTVYHLDDRPADVAAACPETPCVVVHTDSGTVPLLGPAAIDACAGSADALVAAVRKAVSELGLTLR